MRATVKYTLIRVVIFAVALALLLVLRVNVFLSAIIAAAAGFAVAYIFFRKLRDQVALELAARSKRETLGVEDQDTDAEDAALDKIDSDADKATGPKN